jgi:hypothetical protein
MKQTLLHWNAPEFCLGVMWLQLNWDTICTILYSADISIYPSSILASTGSILYRLHWGCHNEK